MNNEQPTAKRPMLGMQGTVIGWLDPWAGAESDTLMRTGTGSVYPSQDPTPSPEAFIAAMREMGVEFYLHHMFPSLAGQDALIRDMIKHDMAFCLGNEYGNINGPFVEGTNRYDVPDAPLLAAAASGKLIGLLYDEPEHLQINADQYRSDDFLPHWGQTDGLTLEASAKRISETVQQRVDHVGDVLRAAGHQPEQVPLIAEHVFPVMFHNQARGGMVPCPKVMKESFQSLQLSTAMGAAQQYNRDLWICADLWGPDVGQDFIRTSGFPGHSPQEYASALRMAYLMGPTHLFTENADVLLRHSADGFSKTVYGEIWEAFVRKFIPEHPLSWTHRMATPEIALIHSDDCNYGSNERLYGNRAIEGSEHSQSIFHAWHLLSHGTIPAHGSCLHIPGYQFPRARLKAEVSREQFPLEQGPQWGPERRVHPLFFPVNNVLAYDEQVQASHLATAKLIVVAGSYLPEQTVEQLRRKAEEGATVIAGEWLLPQSYRNNERLGAGQWIATADLHSDEHVQEAAAPHLGSADCWRQQFGEREVRMYKADQEGFELAFEIR